MSDLAAIEKVLDNGDLGWRVSYLSIEEWVQDAIARERVLRDDIENLRQEHEDDEGVQLQELGDEVHAFAVKKGWWEYPAAVRVERLLKWIIEEANEALAAYQLTELETWHSTDAQELAKPEGYPSEMFDIWSIFEDLRRGVPFDLLEIGRQKMDYNRIRKYKRDAEGRMI